MAAVLPLTEVMVDSRSASFDSTARTVDVFVFNPLAEGYIAYGKRFTPKRHQALLARDLANLPQFLCRQNDIVLLPKRPSAEFLNGLKEVGFPIPEFVEFEGQTIPPDNDLRGRKLGNLRPWAWGPDSIRLLEPLVANLTEGARAPEHYFNEKIAQLYSKAWSANLLRKVLSECGIEPWLCTEDEVGVTVKTVEGALEAVAAIRRRGHHRVIAKQAYGLAGQNSLRLWEPKVLPAHQQWLESAVADDRELVVEPWLERELDFSVQLEMGQGGLQVCGYTSLINDLKGQFLGNWAAPDFARDIPHKVTTLFCERRNFGLRSLYEKIRNILEVELERAGYFGPVGVDAFVYRSPAGPFKVKPIVEINPRYTMGRLAAALMKRTGPGTFGQLRLVNRATVQAMGFAELRDYAQSMQSRFPLCVEGERKIRQGLVCLNEPTRAQACLAMFLVHRTLEDFSTLYA